MDITMPQKSGRESLELIMGFDQGASVIMITSLIDENTAKDCLKIGAKAFVSKDQISADENKNSLLVQLIQKISNGEPEGFNGK